MLSARLWVCFIDRCLSFFFWPLCCLFFFNIRILITTLVSSNSALTSISVTYKCYELYAHREKNVQLLVF